MAGKLQPESDYQIAEEIDRKEKRIMTVQKKKRTGKHKRKNQ